jgi:asparagine synthase (glutamine-hydrolysing)
MCGIAGIFNINSSAPVDRSLLEQMKNVIKHRGPDDEGVYTEAGIGLVHTRLSVIDLSSGHQPMSDPENSVHIAFNGEIYNFLELKKDLELKGYAFRTNSDTEVLLNSYKEYGVECLKRLNGMFAIALWDRKNNQLILARDRSGQKPLYYTIYNSKLYFASELKAILQHKDIPREIDQRSLYDFFTLMFVPAPRTMLKDISKLLPGHYMLIKNGEVSEKSYWDLSFNDKNADETELKEKFIELITDSVKLRMISDVPLGLFLSGGLDSTAILAMMSNLGAKNIKTFSVGIKNALGNKSMTDEREYARMASKCFNTDHHEVEVDPDLVQLLPRIVWHMDDPIGDASAVPTLLLSELTKKHVTVALSGDGSDELWGGYGKHYFSRVQHFSNVIPYALKLPVLKSMESLFAKRAQYKKYILSLQTKPEEVAKRILLTFSVFDHDVVSKLLNNEVNMEAAELEGFANKLISSSMSKDMADNVMYIDFKTRLPDQLLAKVDRMSMATGLEVRAPFLDYRLVELSGKAPISLKLKKNIKKYLIKEAMGGIVPDEIIKRRKQGFSLPLRSWLKNQLGGYLREILLDSNTINRGLYDSEYLTELIDQHTTGQQDHASKLWCLLIMETWCRQFIDGDA